MPSDFTGLLLKRAAGGRNRSAGSYGSDNQRPRARARKAVASKSDSTGGDAAAFLKRNRKRMPKAGY